MFKMKLPISAQIMKRERGTLNMFEIPDKAIPCIHVIFALIKSQGSINSGDASQNGICASAWNLYICVHVHIISYVP